MAKSAEKDRKGMQRVEEMVGVRRTGWVEGGGAEEGRRRREKKRKRGMELKRRRRRWEGGEKRKEEEGIQTFYNTSSTVFCVAYLMTYKNPRSNQVHNHVVYQLRLTVSPHKPFHQGSRVSQSCRRNS